MTFKILKVNHYQQLTKVSPTKLTIRPLKIKTSHDKINLHNVVARFDL